MNKLLTYLILIIVASAAVGCGEENNIDLKKVIQKDNVWYYEDETLPFTGSGTSYFGSGKIESEASFVDGKLNGIVLSYYSNGNIDQKLRYKLGLEIDTSYSYYESGQIERIIVWENEKGYLKRYFENGKLKEEGVLVDELEHGLWSFYYETGVQKSFEIYKNGELTDSSVSYFRNGNIESKGFFIDGLPDGKFSYFDSLTGNVDGYQIFENDSLIESN